MRSPAAPDAAEVKLRRGPFFPVTNVHGARLFGEFPYQAQSHIRRNSFVGQCAPHRSLSRDGRSQEGPYFP